MSIDVNKIITATPDKRIRQAYTEMKKSYNETSANEFFEKYKAEPASAIVENSKLIEFEPYKGEAFYKELVSNPSNCLFTAVEKTLNEIDSYVTPKLNVKDKLVAKDLQESVSELHDKIYEIELVASYIKENVFEDIEKLISDAVVAKDSDTILGIYKEMAEHEEVPQYVMFLYTPFVMEAFRDDYNVIDDISTQFLNKANKNKVEYEKVADDVIMMNKLSENDLYREAVSLTPFEVRNVLTSYMDLDLNEVIKESNTVTEEDAHIVRHTDMNGAVMGVLYDMMESATYETDYAKERAESNKNSVLFCEKTLDLMIYEFQRTGTDSINAKGYNLINGDVTLENAIGLVKDEIKRLNPEYSFFEVTDDDDLDDLEKDSKKDVDKKKDDKDKKDKSDDDEVKAVKRDSTSSVKKPKEKLTTKIQNSALDLRVKYDKGAAERQKGRKELYNAGRALVDIPKSVIMAGKKLLHKADEADDERRKDFMTEPGYRKKIFRNLKLALMYGTAASINLTLVPVLALIRHFSKTKDIRIRNDLEREIKTEIEVTNEKIEQARSDGNRQELYKLIRIRNQLEKELVRVITNSKYI